MSAYPYEVNGEAYSNRLWVALRQERDNGSSSCSTAPAPAR
jgi:hypothetical protein